MFSELAITPMQGLIFGILTLPITLWVIYTDLTSMKIRNQAVLAMLAVFVLAGLFLLPLPDYAWRYLHFAIVLVICFVMSIAMGMGAGDAKYIASVAPFVPVGDITEVLTLYVIWSIILLVGMFVARRLPVLKRAYPNWIWFEEERKSHIPFGLALAPTASTYFALGALAG